MTPIKTARRLRGLSQIALAEAMGIFPQSLNQYESGARTLGPKLLPLAAGILNVSAAYLRGDAQKLAVYDWDSGETIACPIISETVIGSYGMLYLVEVAGCGDPISVILSNGVQFTSRNWQSLHEQALDVDGIADVSWVDGRGNPAIMLDGLPRVLVG